MTLPKHCFIAGVWFFSFFLSFCLFFFRLVCLSWSSFHKNSADDTMPITWSFFTAVLQTNNKLEQKCMQKECFETWFTYIIWYVCVCMHICMCVCVCVSNSTELTYFYLLNRVSHVQCAPICVIRVISSNVFFFHFQWCEVHTSLNYT